MMNLKTKILGGAGALLVTLSGAGAVVAHAATTSNSTTTITPAASHSKYVSEIKTEMQQIKSLQQQRHQLNQEIKTDLKSLKGQHLKKTNPSAYQAIAVTHRQVLESRIQLDKDSAAITMDQLSKNWSKMVADLHTKATDLQGLVDLKQQQLKNVQSALTSTGSSTGSSSSTTSTNASSTSGSNL